MKTSTRIEHKSILVQANKTFIVNKTMKKRRGIWYKTKNW